MVHGQRSVTGSIFKHGVIESLIILLSDDGGYWRAMELSQSVDHHSHTTLTATASPSHQHKGECMQQKNNNKKGLIVQKICNNVEYGGMKMDKNVTCNSLSKI